MKDNRYIREILIEKWSKPTNKFISIFKYNQIVYCYRNKFNQIHRLNNLPAKIYFKIDSSAEIYPVCFIYYKQGVKIKTIEL